MANKKIQKYEELKRSSDFIKRQKFFNRLFVPLVITHVWVVLWSGYCHGIIWERLAVYIVIPLLMAGLSMYLVTKDIGNIQDSLAKRLEAFLGYGAMMGLVFGLFAHCLSVVIYKTEHANKEINTVIERGVKHG